ncbi:MAG: hypothetical protein M0R41_03850 [Methylobacter tundripaludum]|uniref:Uncharacterized protein n=1 Tax=Methylobacter tundripaludum TaxID=173365 RepID=A0A2S6H3K9_9GAMM|nr:hypothetical protein [Methylobacter tundripaludum]MCK9635391.1 hypothetical protein [Methylobacter tundripaludum]PPK72082.1 hypothetical protein B0F88_105194 [Methylobacter tundripaludum]
MKAAYLLNRSKSKSLTAQIKDAERQVLDRQQKIGIRTTILIRKIHQQMTAPATLLLAGGIGFIIGELTKPRTSKVRGTINKLEATETTPLKIALNLVTSARTLYTALPLAWIIKSYFQPGVAGQAPEYQSHPMAASKATGVRRRSRQ